jgi:hypothetical protein
MTIARADSSISATRRFRVRVWLPEVCGPAELDDPAHRVLMKVLAAH